MPTEILNDAVITPNRLHALLRLVPRLRDPSKTDIQRLLQPDSLLTGDSTASPGTKIASIVFGAALSLDLIREDPESKTVSLVVERDEIETADAFRMAMQARLCGVEDPARSNYLLNLYSAWYAVQNERVFTFNREMETNFNQELYPNEDQRTFNMTKFNGWLQWASFLGWGWVIRPSRSARTQLLAPDARLRLSCMLPKLLPPAGPAIPFGEFMRSMAEHCPDLDGGGLFERAWQASRPSESRGSSISLMLSTGLRGLHDSEVIALEARPDAAETWTLYPAAGHPVGVVTHVLRCDPLAWS